MPDRETKISRIAMIVIFLALIRLISECLRLEFVSQDTITFEVLKPYLLGALACSIACLAMSIFSFYSKFKVVICVAVFTIIILVILKIRFFV